jgi:hypothetical protein
LALIMVGRRSNRKGLTIVGLMLPVARR